MSTLMSNSFKILSVYLITKRKRDLKGFKCMTVSLDFTRLYETFRYFSRLFEPFFQILHEFDEVLYFMKKMKYYGQDEYFMDKMKYLTFRVYS